MSVIGFNFTKIKAEKRSKPKGKINIKNNVSIKEVKGEEVPMSTDDREGVRVSFEFVSQFDPDIGNIQLNADVLLLENADKKKALMDTWKEKKNIPTEFVEPLFNLVLRRCNVKALVLAEDLRLPSPIQMGKVKVKDLGE